MNQFRLNFLSRRKVVQSREIASTALPPPQPVPAIEIPGATAPDEAVPTPAHRHRRHSVEYSRRTRLCRLVMATAIAATLAAIACAALGDKRLATLAAAAAAALGCGTAALAWSRRVSRRLMGYALSVGIIAIVVAGGVWAIPDSWFEDADPDGPPRHEAPTRPRRSAAAAALDQPLDCSTPLA